MIKIRMKLIDKVFNRLYWFYKIGYRYYFFKSSIHGCRDAIININKSVKIKHCNINLVHGSSLVIGEGTILQNVNLTIKGNVIIGNNNIISSGNPIAKLSLLIDGDAVIGNNNRLQSRLLMRYASKFSMGNYNNINQESEIRVDDKVIIGSFNQISYKVIIWDTNTHNIYPAAYRRKLAEDKFPVFGYEFEKPKTKPVIIGDDCWIGREAALLKGAYLSDRCVLGFRAVLSDFITEEGTTIVSSISNKVFKNKI